MAESSKPYPSQAQLRLHTLFLNAVNAAIIATDLSGTVIYWNPFAQQLYGWSPEEVMGRNIMEITVSSETEEEARKSMASVLAGNSWAGEFQVRSRNGSFVSALVTLSLVRDEDGEPVAVVGVSQDIEGLKEVEGALRRSEEQFQAFANSVPELCWMAHSDGKVFWRNERWYEYTGSTPQEMEGMGGQSATRSKASALNSRTLESIDRERRYIRDGVSSPWRGRRVPMVSNPNQTGSR